MIPQSMMNGDQIAKTLIASLQAFQRRLERAGDQRVGGDAWTVHEGRPNPRNLPNVGYAVWVMLAGVLPDTSTNAFQANSFIAQWEIHLMTRDQGNDPYGFQLQPGMLLFGGLIRVMTETENDVSLDGAVDEIEFTGAAHEIGPVAGGDQDFSEWIVRFQALHPLLHHEGRT